jgi:hypothetical protein
LRRRGRREPLPRKPSLAVESIVNVYDATRGSIHDLSNRISLLEYVCRNRVLPSKY